MLLQEKIKNNLLQFLLFILFIFITIILIQKFEKYINQKDFTKILILIILSLITFFGIEKVDIISADQMALDYEKSIQEAEAQIENLFKD